MSSPFASLCLLLVAHEVGERETVVHGDVVDARPRTAAVVIEQVARGGHAPAEIAEKMRFARPVAAQRAAEEVVPLRPAGGKPPT